MAFWCVEIRKAKRNSQTRWTFRGAQIPDWGPEFSLCTMVALSGIRVQFLLPSNINLPETLSCLTRNSPRSSKKWSWWWFLRGLLVRLFKEDHIHNISMFGILSLVFDSLGLYRWQWWSETLCEGQFWSWVSLRSPSK